MTDSRKEKLKEIVHIVCDTISLHKPCLQILTILNTETGIDPALKMRYGDEATTGDPEGKQGST
jgi:hypothetical protein